MRRASAGILLLVFVALGGCKPAPAPLSDADRATSRGMDSAFAAAATAGNVDGMTAGYAPDAMVMPPEMPMAHGTDQIRALWTGMMQSGKSALTLKQETADGAGDFMYTTGTYHLEPMPAGSGPAQDGKYLEVFRRGPDGHWMVVADSWNPNTPAPPAAPASKKPAAQAR